MSFGRCVSLGIALALLDGAAALAQSRPEATSTGTLAGPQPVCNEAPDEDALVSICAPPSGPQEKQDELESVTPVRISLTIPSGTPILLALDERTHVRRPGDLVHARVVETVYAFDQVVISAGSIATGHLTRVAPVPIRKRTLAYANGNFSPVHKYELTFDTLTLPDGRQLAIKTSVSPGTDQVVHLVSNPEKRKQKNAAEIIKQEAKGKIQEAKEQAHESWEKITAPGRLRRLKQFLLAQLPYRRQFLQPGTRFVAELDAPLDFGAATRTAEQLAMIGNAPMPDTTLKARLVAEVSSATARRGTAVTAVLTEPIYSAEHILILPADSRLIGEVVQAKPAHRLHHNGELRVIFERIETPASALGAGGQTQAEAPPGRPHLRTSSQSMIGNLEGVEVARNANMKLDEEGGARTTDNKTRYLSTGLAVLLAAAAAHPDAEHGTVDAGGDPGVRTAAGGSGFRLTGALLGLAVRSTPVSIAFGAYGASTSIYSNFLSRGHDVVLPEDTPLEIGFGNPHPPAASQPKSQ